jgi:hypothetical protein
MSNSPKNLFVYRTLDGRNLPAERQVKFLCPEVFYERLKAEKLLQRRPLQELLVEAVERALETWEQDRKIDFDLMRETAEARALQLGLIEFKEYQLLLRKGEFQWVHIWLQFMRELPHSTVQAAQQWIQDTLRYFRSSRLKKKGEAASEEVPSHGETRPQ